jgi:hypothetical protein
MRYPNDFRHIYLAATPLGMFTLAIPGIDAEVGPPRFLAPAFDFLFAILFSRQESRGKKEYLVGN